MIRRVFQKNAAAQKRNPDSFSRSTQLYVGSDPTILTAHSLTLLADERVFKPQL